MAGVIAVCSGLLDNNIPCDCRYQYTEQGFFQNGSCIDCGHARRQHPPPPTAPPPGFVSLSDLDSRLRSRQYSPTDDEKVRFIEMPNAVTPMSPSLQEFIKRHKALYRQLPGCETWDKAHIDSFIKQALCMISTSTQSIIYKNLGYSFDRLLSVSLKPGCSVGIYEVTNQNQPLSVDVDGILLPPRTYCAKVGPLEFLQNERDVAKVVTGNYVMPILDSIELDGYDGIKRLAIIAPLYSGSMADILYKSDAPEDDQIVSMLLSGLSAIYSFSSKGYGHRDIKLENLLKLNSHECVLGDFGSAAQLNPSGETETTANIGMNQKGITIAYDVTCLASAVGYMILRRRLKFGGKNHLLREVQDFVNYPVALEMLSSLIIDDAIENSAEVWNNWNELSLIANKHMPNLFTRFPKLKPTPTPP